MGQDGLGDPDGTEEVDVQMPTDLFLRGFLHHSVEHAAGVVDHDVEPAEGRGREVRCVEHGPAVGDVQRQPDESVRVRLGQGRERFDVAGRGHDAVPGGQGRLGERSAQAP